LEISCLLSEVADEEIADDNLEERVTRTAAEAYRKANSQSDAEDECEYLKRHGVILPNGFTPMPPLQLKIGDDLLETIDNDK